MAVLGFIGTGNMGGALARAAAAHVPAEDILLSNRTPEKAEKLAGELGCAAVTAEELAGRARYIFLGVKPKDMAGCLAALAPALRARQDRFTLVSMAAGLSAAAIQELAGERWGVIRLCPNTPVSIGKGLVLWCEKDVPPGEGQALAEMMAGAGLWQSCPENLIDAAGAVGGCTPAFVYMFIEALADGAVACGLPRAMAQDWAAAAVEGAAALARQDGRHPGALKDAVCSPGGSTIEGVLALEQKGFRAAAAQAVVAAVEKTKKMGQ